MAIGILVVDVIQPQHMKGNNMTDFQFNEIVAGLFGAPCPIAAAELAASEAERIAAFNALSPRAQRAIGCHRCGGKGYLPAYQHIKGGECFACNTR
jgi:hypothetical protein